MGSLQGFKNNYIKEHVRLDVRKDHIVPAYAFRHNFDNYKKTYKDQKL